MAQHDYIISNQTFPNTRADINSVLQALATNNSGTTAPTTQYAGQFWLDTNTPSSTTWTLYIHDGSDDIAFATIDTSANTVNFTDSALDVVTDTTPQLGGNLDLNSNDITGTGNINITGSLTASGNLTSLGIDDNADATAITIDSSERVGLNTTTPGAKLEINSTGSYYNTANQHQQWSYNGTPFLSLYMDAYTSPYFDTDSASTWNPGATMVWKRQGSEKMRIDSSGRLLIGTTDIGYSGFGDDLTIGSASGNNGMTLRSGTSNYGTFYFSDDTGTSAGTYAGKIQYNHSNNSMVFGTNSSDRMTISSAGNVGIGTSAPTPPSAYNGLVINATYPVLKLTSATSGTGVSDGFTIRVNSSDDAQLWHYENKNMSFATNNAERMRIDSSGNVGIGTSSPSAKLHVDTSNSAVAPNAEADDFFVESSSNTGITIGSGISSRSSLYFANSTDNDIARIVVSHADGSMRFHNNASERMRIDSSGNVLVGKTSSGVANVGAEFRNGSSNYALLGTSSSEATLILNRTTTIGDIVIFRYNNTEVGNITVTASATAYNTSSDYRLKENVSYDFDATTRLKQLKPARFNFIADADTTVDGFLAHEVSSVVPEAISGEKDAMRTEDYEVTPAVLDEDGNVITEAVMGTREVPDYQGIDQSKLVPLLVKTIQELEARITTLEANNP